MPAMFAGCYSYVPVELGAISPGMEVRARVAAQAAQDLADTLGLSDTRLLTGTFVGQEGAGGLKLKVQTAPRGTVGAPMGIFKDVTLARAQWLELERVQVDRARTGIMVGIAAVGAGIAITYLHNKGTGDGPATEPPINFNIGLWRLRF